MEVAKKKRAVFVYLTYKFLKKKKERRYWVHPMVSARLMKGAFSTLFIDLRDDEVKFFNYFRMSHKSFDELAARIGDVIRGQDTNMRTAIGVVEMLAVTLR